LDYKTLKIKHRNKLCAFGLGDVFLDVPSKLQATKGKKD
jgi:hypothetical protein